MKVDATSAKRVIDVHCHVGLLGDEYPQWGNMSESYRHEIVYKVFLLYGRLDEDEVSDRTLRAATEQTIRSSQLDHVVCLALDPVYDQNGNRCEERSHMWLDNDYVLDLRRSLGEKVLLGASVHPYDPEFRTRVATYVDQGAALLKWLPSAQQIDLADERVRDALTFLATARDGAALPLLLHAGPEYAIPSTDLRTSSYDYLSWTSWDDLRNDMRGEEKWYRPRIEKVHEHLRAGLREGAILIFAHCGLAYYAPSALGQILEHSDFETVRRYLQEYPADSPEGGRCYADVSACVTPFRRTYFGALGELPPQSLLFGSDFPTPVFELSAGLPEMMEDFAAVLDGQLDRVIIPEDNLLDVNRRELEHYFPEHPMFTNFDALLRNG